MPEGPGACRGPVTISLEEMREHHLDTVDLLISLSEKEQQMARLGLPVLTTSAAWKAFSQATFSQEGRKEKKRKARTYDKRSQR